MTELGEKVIKSGFWVHCFSSSSDRALAFTYPLGAGDVLESWSAFGCGGFASKTYVQERRIASSEDYVSVTIESSHVQFTPCDRLKCEKSFRKILKSNVRLSFSH